MKSYTLLRELTWFILVTTISAFIAFYPVSHAKNAVKKLMLVSPAFQNNGEIPTKYGLENPENPAAQNLSIPLTWKTDKKVLQKTKSYAIIMIDLHPVAQKWVHLAVVNIPKDISEVAEGALSGHSPPPNGALMLTNTYGFEGYGGPNPPKETGSHVYEITLYALNVPSLEVNTQQAYTWGAYRKMLSGKTITQTSIKGKYRIQETSE